MLQIIIIALTVAFTIGNPVEDPRIIGGRPAKDGEFPYQVSLRQLNTSISHFCGGSIISTEWILTAAQCVDGNSVDNILVVAGTNSKHGGFAYIINKIVSHPNYDAQLKLNDIALLRVKGPIALNSKVQTIALATEPPPYQADLILSGWGLTSYPSTTFPDALQTVILWSSDLLTCQKELSGYPVFDTNSCAFLRAAGLGSCGGDAGGPVIHKSKSTQTAIVSWSIPCATGKPDVFTSIPSYRSWIKQISGV